MKYNAFFWIGLISYLFPLICRGEIITDGRLGPATSLSAPHFQIEESLGQRRGNNLFHSFSRFNLQAGESATFTGDASIQQIIGRITDNQPSSINGTIRNEIPQAALYLFNPHGFIFGEQAKLDVLGSLYLGSADSVYFEDSAQFSASQPDSSGLSMAPVQAFGFLDNNQGQIRIIGSHLQVPSQQTLALETRNHLQITNSQLNAPEGGNLSLHGKQIDIDTNSRLSIATTNQTGGLLQIEGQQLQLNEESYIDSNTLGKAQGGNININVDEVHISQASGISVGTAKNSQGNAGHLRVQADRITLTEQGYFNTSTLGMGNGGNIEINARQQVRLTDKGIIASSIGDLLSSSQGNGGHIHITTPDLQLSQRAALQTGSFGRTSGAAGNISVNANTVNIHSSGTVITTTVGEGTGGLIHLQAQAIQLDNGLMTASSVGKGNAGLIQLDSDQLQLTDTSIISTSALRAGGGDITINVIDTVQLLNSSITARAQGQLANHDGGNLTISRPQFLILNNSSLLASAYAGNGGNIQLQAAYLIASSENILDASSALGLDGQVLIDAPDTNISGTLTILPTHYLHIENLMKQRCAARLGLNLSSLSAKTYEILPLSPYGLRSHVILKYR